MSFHMMKVWYFLISTVRGTSAMTNMAVFFSSFVIIIIIIIIIIATKFYH
jgi:hypothetical protein